MIKLLISSLLTFSALAQVVFLDLNNNDLEKESAIKAAKEAGKEIVVYPADTSLFDEKEALKLLKKHKPDSIFISGHDGGGFYSGDRNESFERSTLNEFMRNNPDVAENVRTLGLIGCNTGNYSQIKHWKEEFPNLAFIAGYDGSAPSQKWIQGRTFIEEIILKSDDIVGEADKDRIKELFEGFSYMDQLEVSLYTTACSENPLEQYIFRPKAREDLRFKTFDSSECNDMKTKYNDEYRKSMNAYRSGEKAIPENRATGELRDIYTFLRQNEHCFEDEIESNEVPDADSALFTLFYKDVFENFNVYYEDELGKLFSQLKELEDVELLKKRKVERFKEYQDELALLKSFQADPSKFREYSKKAVDQFEEDLKAEYPSEYYEIYDELFKIADREGVEAAMALVGEQEDKFQYEFFYKRSELSYYHESLEKDDSSLVEVLEWQVSNLEVELESFDFKDPEGESKKYKRLKAKNLEEFKKLDRKETLEFIHELYGIDYNLVKQPELLNSMRVAADIILTRLYGDSIPFNWHDSNLGEPVHPESMNLNKITINDYIKNSERELKIYLDY